ncbi:acyl-CoA desaturase [bacterium (Candidatus Blackallbacteria) CG17_big_fil_post_rev_8_21_14_2_50_48_46]|uniref:Acyl-CoA desaturase n=1 Tax=bacterium (Candidatus Blackallbacteria) CG17_big_fil_post_rev_8_21_14_2_50_48_46 TaxID=2014261 RepID=A0A2M7G9E4_9BACT|nr:MAG: acyl-CoA desaturase [bacterium (Candidatus Blackallbacteria) CG18_big_fil_WC_8_21_14_2_50_49_26]PIW18720.1 MAG: acyl-CoA desaturase [bacterium (Candidatus Blackallbacteria) CG17_big_fil_post_rev_8_21_14_2_50_48_46]PIW50575.1 MAG: acyl-CoA desaturase [bacterium (Candidatus Blackallbacteria) CG13_big_fil_rev_8_21_14_2_50_49_14]
MHLACFGALFTGVSPIALGVMAALYFVRMFAITAFYHRYFSHRSFKTSRLVQFLFGLLGASAAQQGPLWWAEKHRHHHYYSDQPEDIHSPLQSGFWMSHIGWIPLKSSVGTNYSKIPDLAKFPELVWLNENHILAPVALGLLTFLLGEGLAHFAPALGTHGFQMLVWGFFISTVILYHGTFTINSLCHVWGSRRYATGDGSRNNFWLALLTLGEGWHNNHHYYATSTRQGFYWWELDISYYLLRLLGLFKLVWGFKKIPEHLKNRHLKA